MRACSKIACQSIFCVVNFYTRHSFDYRESKTTVYFFCLEREPITGGVNASHKLFLLALINLDSFEKCATQKSLVFA